MLSESASRGRTSWPHLTLLVAFGVGCLIAAILLPRLDMGDGLRLITFLCIVVIYLGRWLWATIRATHDDSWRIYVIMILAAPFLIELTDYLARKL